MRLKQIWPLVSSKPEAIRVLGRLSVHLSHAPAGRTVKRLLLEEAVEAYSIFTPAKSPVLETEDVNTIGS